MRKVIFSTVVILIVVLAAGFGMLYVIGDRLIEEAIMAELEALEEELSLSLENELDAVLDNADGENLEVRDQNSIGENNSVKEDQPKSTQPESAEGIDKVSETAFQNHGNKLNGSDGKSGNTNNNPGNANAGDETKNTDSSGQNTDNLKENISNTKENSQNEGKQDVPASSENNRQDTSGEKDTRVFTPEKIVQVKNKVSTVDKIEASALALKRLSLSDINELISMISGGVTREEKERAKQIAYSRFSEEEIKKIKEMYAKYIR